MVINCKKSSCLRVGNRHNSDVKMITVGENSVPWHNEIRYLGITILSAKKFTVNLQRAKQKYFRALNSIFGKIGLNSSPVVICSLINVHCLPILLYGAESLLWNQRTLNSIENACSQAFTKIFRTFDKDVIEYCQLLMGYLPIKFLLDYRKLCYLTNIDEMRVQPIYCCLCANDNELITLFNKYNLDKDTKHFNFKQHIWKYFESTVNT